MKKFARLAVASSLLAAMLGIGAAPAGAHNAECTVATGTATLGVGGGVNTNTWTGAFAAHAVAAGGVDIGLWQPLSGNPAALHNPSVSSIGNVGNVTFAATPCVPFDGGVAFAPAVSADVDGNGLPNGGRQVPPEPGDGDGPQFAQNAGDGGYCGQSNGYGTVVDADLSGNPSTHNFTYTSAGTQLVLTGEVVGVVNAVVDSTFHDPGPPAPNNPVPHHMDAVGDPTHPNSCLDGTAHMFLIDGVVNLQGY